MIEEILNPLATGVVGVGTNAAYDLIKAVWSYLGLKDYLLSEYSNIFEDEEIVNIYAYSNNASTSGDELFWGKVLTGGISDGTKVSLYNFQVSPWFPRKPGAYWTHSAAKARRYALKNHIERVDKDLVVFDVWGKTLMSELGGIGSVNIRKNRDKALFSLSASGHTDRGIPVICPQTIWSDISRSLEQNQLVEIDVGGTIKPLPLEYDSYFLRSSGIPKIVLSIDSILNINIKQSDLTVIVSPWTIFKTNRHDRPYGFTYMTHDLSSSKLDETVSWIEDYVYQHDGISILTDFDEATNSLNARFPLNSCMDGSITTDDFISYCQQISRDFKTMDSI